MPYLTPDVLDTTRVTCKRLRIPQAFSEFITGALLELTYERNWEQFGGVTPEQAAEAMRYMLYEYNTSPEVCMIGTIFPYIAKEPPGGTLPCDGRSLDAADYPLLAAAVADAWKITRLDGRTFILLPDLRGRVVVGSSTNHVAGSVGGSETHTLSIDELPSHTHTAQPHMHNNIPHEHIFAVGIDVPVLALGPGEIPTTWNSGVPTIVGTAPTGIIIEPSGVTINSAGQGQSHNNMPPFIALNYCIVVR